MTDKAESINVIAAAIAEWNAPFVEKAIFGIADAVQIARQVDTFCLTELDCAIAEYLFYESSQGAVFGLRWRGSQGIYHDLASRCSFDTQPG